jgi:putative FmdB family regulatory protein
MPRYDYRCPFGHETEAIFSMGDAPQEIPCTSCPDAQAATRVFSVPAAIHFHGSGFYNTDVNGRTRRKRRPNPGDDLYKEFDTAAARIADAI